MKGMGLLRRMGPMRLMGRMRPMEIIKIGPIRPIGLISLMLFAFMSAHAQYRGAQGWIWQNPLPQGNPLNSIHFAKDKLSGFAVGADNTVLRTQDGGFTWQRQALPEDLTLSSVFVKDKKNAVIVGARGGIFTTDDGGHAWRTIKTDAKDHLYAIAFAGETGWATGTYGRVLKTSDGGATWIAQTVGTDEHLAKVAAFDAQTAVVAGVNGVVLTALDGG